MDKLRNRIIIGFSFLSELINFTRRIRTVRTHHRTKGTKLQPSYIQFLIIRVCQFLRIFTQEESPYIRIPVRNSGKREIQSSRNLPLKRIPCPLNISRPCIRPISLLSSKCGTSQNKHTLIGRDLTLMVVYPSNRHQRIRITHFPETSQESLFIQVFILEVQMVRFRRIHPPAIHSQGKQSFVRIFPIDITGFWIIGIVNPYPRQIIFPWRPQIRSCQRPCLKVEKHSLLIQFLIRLCHRSKRRPDRDYSLGIHAMNILHHFLRIPKLPVQEFHGIPQIISTPILPVLDDTVERNLQLTILVHHSYNLILTLIPFPTLPETISPKREHRYLTCQFTHIGYYPVGVTTGHEIIIDELSYFRFKKGCLFIINKPSRRIIVPKYTISFHRLEECDHIFHVSLNKILILIPLTEFSTLHLPQTINRLILVQLKDLFDTVIARIYSFFILY